MNSVRANSLAALLVRSSILILTTLGIFLAVGSFLPYDLLKAKVAAYVPRGSAEFFTEAFFNKIVLRVRLAAAGLLLGSTLLYLVRKAARAYLGQLLVALRRSDEALRENLSQAIATVTGKDLFAVLLLALISAGLRILFLFQPIEWDEAVTFTRYTSRPLWIIVSWYSDTNNHVFHSILVHLTSYLFGQEPWALRLPAFLAGLLIIPAAYAVGCILYNKDVALLTATVLAVSSPMIALSTVARGHSIICLVFLFLVAALSYVKDYDAPLVWLLAAILSALGFYTAPIMLYPFAVVVCWLLLSAWGKSTGVPPAILWKRVILFVLVAALFTLFLYLPILAVTGAETVLANPRRNPALAPLSWGSFGSLWLLRLPEIWIQWHANMPRLLRALLAGGFLVGLFTMKGYPRHRLPLIAGAICLFPLVVMQRFVPPARMFLFLLPLYLLTAFAGLTLVVSKMASGRSSAKAYAVRVLAIILATWLGYNVAHSQVLLEGKGEREIKEEYRETAEIAAFLKKELRPGDRLVTPPFNEPLKYYLQIYGLQSYQAAEDPKQVRRLVVLVHRYRVGQTVETVLNEAGLVAGNYPTPRLLRRFPQSTFYEINVTGN